MLKKARIISMIILAVSIVVAAAMAVENLVLACIALARKREQSSTPSPAAAHSRRGCAVSIDTWAVILAGVSHAAQCTAVWAVRPW